MLIVYEIHQGICRSPRPLGSIQVWAWLFTWTRAHSGKAQNKPSQGQEDYFWLSIHRQITTTTVWKFKIYFESGKKWTSSGSVHSHPFMTTFLRTAQCRFLTVHFRRPSTLCRFAPSTLTEGVHFWGFGPSTFTQLDHELTPKTVHFHLDALILSLNVIYKLHFFL